MAQLTSEEYSDNLLLISLFQLTIIIGEKNGPNGGRTLIDQFTVVLSLSAAENDIYQIGDVGIVAIKLRYKMFCKNSSDCPTTYPSSGSKPNEAMCKIHLLFMLLVYSLFI